MLTNELSNIELLKEIAELLNEETEMENMLQGALHKLLEGTLFETGWIFFIDEKGRQKLIAQSNLPNALKQNDCRQLQKGGCWCVSRFQKGELKRPRILLSVKELSTQERKVMRIVVALRIMQQCPYNQGKKALVY